MKYFIILLLSCTAFAQLPDSLRQQFDYVRMPVQYKIISSSGSAIVTEEITYQSADGFTVSAYLVYPRKPEKVPLAVFQHWGEGDKSEFLKDAQELARSGFVSILPDGPWKCPGSNITSFTRQGYQMYRQNVINDMIAIDLAEQRFNVDKYRIYMIGHSFGCNTAAIMSAVDSRIDGFVFIAGAFSTTRYVSSSPFPDFVEWRTTKPEAFAKWIKEVRPLDAELYLPHKTKPSLIQVAEFDEYISKAQNEEFIAGTPEPKSVKRYNSGHGLNESATNDRINWLKKLARLP